MEKKVLVMTFTDNANKDFTLRLDNPVEGLGQEEISPVMDAIVASKVFPQEGSLTAPKKAEIVVTNSQTVYQAAQ